ncbi:MAG TPA: DUF1761 domain-containing protein [Chryseolinea sp.]|nr:DUF1761 domain-containing protein [Chryseolinea sp.]
MEEQQLGINMVAILVAVVANFILGFLWYTPLFGKAWAKELGFDMSVKPPASTLVKGMIFMVIGNFFLAYVLAHNIAAWSFVPGIDKMSLPVQILNSALFTWLGFFVPVDLSRVAWEKGSWKLFFINTGYHFMTLLVASAIITYMR